MDADPSQHPADEMLHACGLGKLSSPAAEQVLRHLEACPECRRRVAELSADSFLGRFRDARRVSGESRGASTPGRGAAAGRAGPPPPKETLPPGLADHSDYEIVRELGRGGMGVVYLAHNRLMGRDEVLKVMGREVIDRPGLLDRFLREIRAVARLRHPNIVAAYSALRIGESIVLAMEYVPGLDLAKLVKLKGPMPVSHACLFAYQAALGLQHAHEEGLVHRDIKPGNLIVSRKGDRATVKVLDFGLAKATSERTHDGSLTVEGQALGTPDYIAPEQILNAQGADIRADIYSLGGTLYYLLSGHPPFRAKSLYDLYQAHISRDASPLNLVRPQVPSELAALVAKMMDKEPGRRFQTPGEFADVLRMFFERRPRTSPPGPEFSRLVPQEAGRRRTISTPTQVPPGKWDKRSSTSSSPARSSGSGSMLAGSLDSWQADPEEDVPLPTPPIRSRKAPARSRRALLLTLFAFACLCVLGVVIKLRSPDGAVTWIDVPAGTTIEVERSGESVVLLPDDQDGSAIAEVPEATPAMGVGLTPTPPSHVVVANGSGGNILMIDLKTGEQTIVASGDKLRRPLGVAVGDGRRVLVVDEVYNRGSVIVVDIVTGAQSVLSSELRSAPSGIAIDREGRLYVAEQMGNSRVVQLDPTTGSVSASYGGRSTFNRPMLPAIRGNTLVVACRGRPGSGEGDVRLLDLTTGAVTRIASLGGPAAAEVDANGHFLVTDGSHLYRIESSSHAVSTVATGFGSATGLAFLSEETIVMADKGEPRRIWRVNTTTGEKSVISEGGHLIEPFQVAVYPTPPRF